MAKIDEFSEKINYGYARVSTQCQARDGNSLEAQKSALREAGATEIYADAFTGTKTDRPELNKLLEKIAPGDTLIFTKLDRVARNLAQGIELIENLAARQIKVHVLNIGIIDESPAGKLIRNVMLAFAEFERDMIVQRTKEGKAIARTDPNFKEGRQKKFTEAQINHARELLKTNTYANVVAMTVISRSTLKRINK
ncbi:recombinase family protein [Ruminobacter amylophilus]|uniref:recombinase family protein n=1 Tax=Ruminobacter amylophilus TaxID=867 RepID=UPI00386AAA48